MCEIIKTNSERKRIEDVTEFNKKEKEGIVEVEEQDGESFEKCGNHAEEFKVASQSIVDMAMHIVDHG